MEGLLSILADECTGTVAGVTAQNGDGESIDLELLLLPLGVRRPSFARTIGVLAPLKVPPWLGATPIGALTLGGRRHIGAELEKRLLPRFMAPARPPRPVVYDGGRVEPARAADEGEAQRRLGWRHRPRNDRETNAPLTSPA